MAGLRPGWQPFLPGLLGDRQAALSAARQCHGPALTPPAPPLTGKGQVLCRGSKSVSGLSRHCADSPVRQATSPGWRWLVAGLPGHTRHARAGRWEPGNRSWTHCLPGSSLAAILRVPRPWGQRRQVVGSWGRAGCTLPCSRVPSRYSSRLHLASLATPASHRISTPAGPT